MLGPIGMASGLSSALGQVSMSDSTRPVLDEMLPLVYEELHRLASSYLARERPDHTLQPTALVHEAYLRLVPQRGVDWGNRAQFLGVAAGMMRRILVNHARDRAAGKRGGGRRRVSLSHVELPAAGGEAPDIDLIVLEDALVRLAALDERKAKVVELRFFGGLTMSEVAEVLGISLATVEREWSFSRAWLFDAIDGSTPDGGERALGKADGALPRRRGALGGGALPLSGRRVRRGPDAPRRGRAPREVVRARRALHRDTGSPCSAGAAGRRRW
jgi:RNA polymerase sigma factor (TIGR02999 family)